MGDIKETIVQNEYLDVTIEYGPEDTVFIRQGSNLETKEESIIVMHRHTIRELIFQLEKFK